ncbi:hypothetical protein NJ7G_2168 [Natrinema sp. J7-2]|nr:hypothetical protein NJ7G_2168 [Natrinema sp. J7-2]
MTVDDVRISREVKRRTSAVSNCVGHVAVETTDDWLRSFTFA